MHKGKYASISIKYKTFFSVILIIATLYGNCIYGQNENQIIGIVQGSNEELLMGNVLLLSNQDSTLVKGAFYMDGVIKLERPTEAGLLLRITSMGYSDTTLVLKNSQGELNLGTITLNESTLSLEEVSINGSRPLIVQSTNGTTTAHVQNTLLSSSTSINELLSKLPNLIADETGISVLGKGEPLYYLNGKRISQNQLTSMQVNQISQVEIINNPSAKYDAQGKAVVNIISIVNTRDGMQGNIMQNTSLAKHLLSYTDMNLHWRKGKWAIAADYGIDRGQHWGANLLKRETLNSENNSYFTNDFESNSKSRYVAKYRLGTSYQIDKKSNISIEYLGAQNIRDQNSQATTVFSDDSEIGSTINATTKGTLSNLSNAINANYNIIIDTLGSNLFIGAQYARFVSDDESIIDEIISNNWNIASATRLNLSSSSIQYIIGQFDLEKLLREETIINIGAKITRANNTGLVDFFSKSIDQTDFIYYPDLSNDFEYSEYIPAAYFQLNKNFNEKLNLELGIRTEYTNAQGNSNSLSATIIDTSYLNFFPNASMQIAINKKINIGISYSSSINRPSYQALDPFLFYIDSLTSTQGNPELSPEYAHSFETSFSLKQYSLIIGYTNSTDAFRYAMLEGDNGPNSTILKQFNIEKEHSYYTSITLPVKYKNFNSVNVFGLTLDKIQDNRREFQTNEFIPRAYFYTRNSLLIDKIGKIELNAQYLGTRFDGIYYRKPAFTASAGISRSFFRDKLKCSFTISDFLKTFEVDGYYQLANSKVSYLRQFDSHFYRLSLRYTFGKSKEINFSTKNVGKNEDSRIQQ